MKRPLAAVGSCSKWIIISSSCRWSKILGATPSLFVPNLNKIEAKIFRKKKNRQFEETEVKTKLIDWKTVGKSLIRNLKKKQINRFAAVAGPFSLSLLVCVEQKIIQSQLRKWYSCLCSNKLLQTQFSSVKNAILYHDFLHETIITFVHPCNALFKLFYFIRKYFGLERISLGRQ